MAQLADDHAARDDGARDDPRHRGVHVAGAGEGASRSTGAPTSGRSAVVLYEMLAGGGRSTGEDVSDTLAAILRGEPDWTMLPALPPRWTRSSAGAWSATGVGASGRCPRCDSCSRIPRCCRRRAPPPRRWMPARRRRAWRPPWRRRAAHVLMRRVLPLAGLAAVAVAAAGVGFSRDVTPPPPPAPVARFLLGLPEGQVLGTSGADHGVVAQWQRAGLPHGGSIC